MNDSTRQVSLIDVLATRGRLVLLLLVACVLATGALSAEDLLWEQRSDGQSQYGPSVELTTGSIDQELADDFVLTATISRVFAAGSSGFPPPPQANLVAVEVRFYDVATDGRPGSIQAEYVLAADDPNLSYDPAALGPVDITLSPPFDADGGHFLGVQLVTDQSWYPPSSNSGNPRGSAIWIRDYIAGGGWEPYEDILGVQNADIVFSLYGDLTGAPTIDTLSASSLDRSGRLRVVGGNFGGTQGAGTVLIDGEVAWVGSWSDTTIDVWVPEAAGPGQVNVEVVTEVGASDPASLNVTLRQQVDKVRWRFETDGRGVRHRPGIGADGTIYVQDTKGLLYALTPDGGLKWVFTLGGLGGEGPVAVGHDGTIYVTENPLGAELNIIAVHPDGTLRWLHTEDGAQRLISGPGVGPDGNVYAVTNLNGVGALSLTPEGALRWANPGSPPFTEFGSLGTEIAFGADRFYVAFDESGINPISLLYGLDFDGSQLFAVGRPDDGAQPTVGPDGSVYLQTWHSAEGILLSSYDPSGNLEWDVFQGITNTLSHPGVGADGTIYAVRNLIEINAVRPDGSIEWTVIDPNSSIYGPVVSPDDTNLVIGNFDIGGEGRIKGWSTSGEPLWTIVLPRENGGALSPAARAIFAPGGLTAYVGVEPLIQDDQDEHSYLYAVDTSADDASALVLSQTDLVRGSPTELTVTGAEPGERVRFLASPVGTGDGPCPGQLGGLCLDLLRPIRNLGVATADAGGTAVLSWTVPGSLPGSTLHTQAIVVRGSGGENSVKSSTISAPVLP